jgi:hypothetical protein
MQQFIKNHSEHIMGTLSGLDRLRLRGTIRWLATVEGMAKFLGTLGILLKDFRSYAQDITHEIRSYAQQLAEDASRPYFYLASSADSKEELARDWAERDGIREGLIAVFRCVEPCWSYQVVRNREKKQLELRGGPAKCLHLYFYFLDRVLGLIHLRLQTWFPFTIHLCLNGREWLTRALDAKGIAYVRRANCLVDVEDFAAAQKLLNRQLRTDWPWLLDRQAARCFPLHQKLWDGQPLYYYWSAEESEWATDVVFRSREALTAVYPSLVRHGIETFSSSDVMRFLGRPTPASGHVHGRFLGEVVSDVRRRPEGVRIKHRLNANSIKMYDKQGSVLRVETTINDARDIKVYRAAEGDSEGPKAWRRLRKGVSDLHRRSQVSQAANERYLDALSAANQATPLGELAEHVTRRVTWQGRPVRGLNPLASQDAVLLTAVSRGEFSINGFRNRDLRAILFQASSSPTERRSQASRITRQLRMLRAHGLIKKVPKTHRYVLTDRGRTTIIALLTARKADTQKLNQLAA